MYALHALRRALSDLHDESFFIIGIGLAGAVISFLILSIPLVLAAHYGSMLWVSEGRATSFRDWLRLGRSELRFFTLWFLLVLAVTLVLAAGVLYYLQLGTAWSTFVAWIMLGFFVTWLSPQPFVPAFYLQQRDRRLRVALRNTAVFVVTEPFSLFMFWVSGALVALPVVFFAWPLLPALVPFATLVSTLMVKSFVKSGR